MDVKDLINKDIDFICPSDTLREAQKKMDQLNVGIMPVFEAGQPMGMLQKADIIKHISGSRDDPEKTPVRLLLR